MKRTLAIRSVLVGLPLVLALLGACAEPEAPEPHLDRISPSVVGLEGGGWLTLEGHGFEPRYTGLDGGASIEVAVAHDVVFGGVPSPEVRWHGVDRLVAKVPAGLPEGPLDVTVVSPYGREARLDAGLCVGAREERAFVHYCLRGPLEAWTFANLCVTDDAGREDPPREVMRNALFDLASAPAVSEGGSVVAAVRGIRDGGADRAEVVVLRPFDDGFATDDVIALRSAPLPRVDQSPYGRLVLTRDGGTLLVIEEGRRLLAFSVPDDATSDTEPTVLHEEPAGSGFSLSHVDVDPLGRHVVFTRTLEIEPLCVDPEGADPLERHALWRVPIDGGEAVQLLDEVADGGSNGPATHLPTGDALLFASNRLGLTLPLGGGCLHEIVNLFVLDLVTGEITPATKPTTMAPFGPPIVSPDGRWAAIEGLLADDDAASLDILLVDLDAREVVRAYRPERSCINPLQPWQCPFVSVAPSFAPDGRSLIASGVAEIGGLPSTFLYEVTLPDALPDLPPYDRTLPRQQVDFFAESGLAPRYRDGYRGCSTRR